MPRRVIPQYDLILLGTLGGPSSHASAINNRGEVVGGADVEQGRQHAFIWQNGVMRDLDSLDSAQSLARSINERGDVVGAIDLQLLDSESRAFLWSHEGLRLIEDEHGLPSSAFGINDNGDVVGWYGTRTRLGVGERTHASAWIGGKRIPLSSGSSLQPRHPADSSHATAINNAGQIVGTVFGEAFLWAAGEIHLFGLAEENGAAASAINSAGQVVGCSWHTYGSDRAFLCNHGYIVELRGLGGQHRTAHSINDHGLIVGTSMLKKRPRDGSPIEHGCLWIDQKPYDLNDLVKSKSGWVIEQASGINNVGQIVGTAVHAGARQAALLNPVSD